MIKSGRRTEGRVPLIIVVAEESLYPDVAVEREKKTKGRAAGAVSVVKQRADVWPVLAL